MNGELLDIICCPETKQDLTLIDRDTVKKINKAIKSGKLKNRAGETIKDSIDDGLIREDEKYIYPVRYNIPVLLINEAIEASDFLEKQ